MSWGEHRLIRARLLGRFLSKKTGHSISYVSARSGIDDDDDFRYDDDCDVCQDFFCSFGGLDEVAKATVG